MDKIQLLYVENNISQKKRLFVQTLSFYMRVYSLDYQKQVEVLWAGNDGVWHSLAAIFQHKVDDQEFWHVRVRFQAASPHKLPGNIQFGLRYRVLGQDYWDNQSGANYHSPANSGLQLAGQIQVLNIGFAGHLHGQQKLAPITVAVDPAIHAKKVTVHWTTDNWLHTHKTACHLNKKIHPARQHSAQIWTAGIKIDQAFRLEYCLVCETEQQQYWDNHYGKNYQASRQPLKLLILNLHCYQEIDQDQKFSLIARAINENAIDIICFQEVAELWNDSFGDWPSNSANIINSRLARPFHIYTDWSHLGFDKYREGVAILSRYPLHKQESRYVSESQDIYSIHSRKVVMAQIHAPGFGALNVYSAHLSWWEDGFAGQFQHLSQWASDKHDESVSATLLCGDFNITAGSAGYDLVVTANEYDDQFLAANSQGVFEKIFKVNDPYWRDYLCDDYRIDYIFLNKASKLKVISAMVLFTDQDYGRVSDHCGYLLNFEPY